jgi:site-specific DNA recombinase
MNPRYTGRQVWNRQRRDEVLVDVEDVAAGYESRLRWNEATDWAWSNEESHEAIISAEQFERVAAQMTAAKRPHSSKRHRTERTYVLSGLVHCSLCGHRMQGNANHGENH